MSDWTLTIENLRALRRVEFRPPSLCAIIGENGAGKSTLLTVFRFLRWAFARDLPYAISNILIPYQLKHWAASEREDIVIQFAFDDGLIWRLTLFETGGFVQSHERLSKNDEVIVSRDPNGFFYNNTPSLTLAPERLAIHAISLAYKNDPHIQRVLNTIVNFYSFADLDTHALRLNGSNTTHSTILDTRCKNAITLLRRWHQEKPHRDRYQFVLEGLQDAFPHLVSDLDFQEAGQTIVMRVYPPNRENPSQLAFEANGLTMMLMLLCTLAEANKGEVIAIDEPENGLHPYAQRQLIEIASQRAEQKHFSIILATHSTTMLDVLRPEQVFVLQPNRGLTRADVMHDPKWLSRFQLGELYKNGELGSNDDTPITPST